MEPNLLDRMLCSYLTERKPVSVTLQNKVRVNGTIKAFDSYVIILEGEKQEILYRHAVSSIAPFIPEAARQPSAQKSTSGDRQIAAPVSPRPAKYPSQKTGTPRLSTRAAAAVGETSINNGMKEGLLKWMREQKAK